MLKTILFSLSLALFIGCSNEAQVYDPYRSGDRVYFPVDNNNRPSDQNDNDEPEITGNFGSCNSLRYFEGSDGEEQTGLSGIEICRSLDNDFDIKVKAQNLGANERICIIPANEDLSDYETDFGSTKCGTINKEAKFTINSEFNYISIVKSKDLQAFKSWARQDADDYPPLAQGLVD